MFKKKRKKKENIWSIWPVGAKWYVIYIGQQSIMLITDTLKYQGSRKLEPTGWNLRLFMCRGYQRWGCMEELKCQGYLSCTWQNYNLKKLIQKRKWILTHIIEKSKNSTYLRNCRTKRQNSVIRILSLSISWADSPHLVRKEPLSVENLQSLV